MSILDILLRGSVLVLLVYSMLVEAANEKCFNSHVAWVPKHIEISADASLLLQKAVTIDTIKGHAKTFATLAEDEHEQKYKDQVSAPRQRQVQIHFWNGGNVTLSCYRRSSDKGLALEGLVSVGKFMAIDTFHGQSFVFTTDGSKDISVHYANASRGQVQHYIIGSERSQHHERPIWPPCADFECGQSTESTQSPAINQRDIHIMGSTDLFRCHPSFAQFILGHVLPVAWLLDSEGLLTPTEAQSLRLIFSCPPGQKASDAVCNHDHIASSACCQGMLNPGDGENRLAFYGALFPLGAQLVAWPPQVNDDTRVLVFPDLLRATPDKTIYSVVPKLHWMVLHRVPRAERKLQMLYVSRHTAHTKHTRFFNSRRVLNEQSLLIQLKSFAVEHDLNLHSVSLESMPLAEQVTLLSNTDVLVTYHGAALSYAAVLPPRSIVVEILPSGFDYCFFHSMLSHQTIWIQDIDEYHVENRSAPWSAKNNASWNSSRGVNPSAFLRALHQTETLSATSLIACPEQESSFQETMSTWMNKYSSNDKHGVYCPSHSRVRHSLRSNVSQGAECKHVRKLADGAVLVSEGPSV